MAEIHSAIACNLDADILSASLPLFESGSVDAIEWSFDALHQRQELPEWFRALLTAFSRSNRLIGHGIFFSIFSGKWLPEQEQWLKSLKKYAADFHFDHITEHFGFMTGKDFHHGAPLSIPFSPVTLAIGIDRLQRIQEACRCPVGLENLAFSYSLDDVKRHGAFLEKLVEPVNGFIILDLHNLFCQTHNFNVDFEPLLACYPLDRVREIHISGGSWEPSVAVPSTIIRRDTHDEKVPDTVFDFLRTTIPRCPNLKFVVLEQLGTGLRSEASRVAFRDDFLQIQRIVKAASLRATSINTFQPPSFQLRTTPVEDSLLYRQQTALSRILEEAGSEAEARSQLEASVLAHSDWQIEHWNAAMLETAVHIAQKWKNGFTPDA
ncbi:MAG: DUF692 family protein [Niabella sp.]|nr:DUF692 family protein [Niabella sp.]